MRFPRACGILLHPTSLPGRFGIGDLGAGARQFVDFLAASRQSLWQVLPLGPTGYGDSPYQCFSAFAGNPLLIDLEPLLEGGLLEADDLKGLPAFPQDRVDYGQVIPFKLGLLQRAAGRFRSQASHGEREEFAAFCRQRSAWLDDFALFMALKQDRGGAPWSSWEPELIRREPAALSRAREALSGLIEAHQFVQFQFFRQWAGLRGYANQRGIRIIGDVPIFVAYDSADVWARPELFHLDDAGRPTVVAGVPPDYFSATGQLWGNPLYRWDALKGDGYAWWIDRIRSVLELVDVIRIDHFRGFEAYWEVPAGETTAVNGRWVEGPGADFFHAVGKALGDLPIIAEDLGLITPAVEELRDAFALPGMKVLQFAFGEDADHPYLPHNFERNCVVYTGTHDNDTTRGWYENSSTPAERDHARRYMAVDGQDIAWDMMRLAVSSVADQAIYPLQDALNLGSEARMNQPGRPAGNWSWRYRSNALTDDLAGRLRELALLYGRWSEEKQESSPGGRE